MFQSVEERQPKVEVLAVSQFKAPVVMVRPEPARLLTLSPFTMRLVVEAVTKLE